MFMRTRVQIPAPTLGGSQMLINFRSKGSNPFFQPLQAPEHTQIKTNTKNWGALRLEMCKTQES